MSSQLGPIGICCDSPPYPVVQACRRLGFYSPEDVRWLRTDEFGTPPDPGQQGSSMRVWKMLWKRERRQARTCTCGEPWPVPRLVSFTFNTGDKAAYFLAQCGRCRTVFWDESR